MLQLEPKDRQKEEPWSPGFVLETTHAYLQLCAALAPARLCSQKSQATEMSSRRNSMHSDLLPLGSQKCWHSELGSAILINILFFTAF